MESINQTELPVNPLRSLFAHMRTAVDNAAPKPLIVMPHSPAMKFRARFMSIHPATSQYHGQPFTAISHTAEPSEDGAGVVYTVEFADGMQVQCGCFSVCEWKGRRAA